MQKSKFEAKLNEIRLNWKVKNIGRKLTFNNSTIQQQSRLNLLEGKYNDKQAEFGYPWCGGKNPFF